MGSKSAVSLVSMQESPARSRDCGDSSPGACVTLRNRSMLFNTGGPPQHYVDTGPTVCRRDLPRMQMTEDDEGAYDP